MTGTSLKIFIVFAFFFNNILKSTEESNLALRTFNL